MFRKALIVSIININELGMETLTFQKKANLLLEIKAQKTLVLIILKKKKYPDWPPLSSVILSSVQAKSMRKLTWKQ